MSQKKQSYGKSHKKAAISTPVGELNAKETIEHYNAIMIEEVKSSTKFLVDAMMEMRLFFTNELNQFRAETNERFTILEGAFRCLKADVEELKNETKEIRTDMRHMEDRLAGKIDKLAIGQENHEIRITTLEAGRI